MQEINLLNSGNCQQVCTASDDDRREKVVAKMPQGYDTNIRIHLVPGRNIGMELVDRRCRPRHAASRPDVRLNGVPVTLVAKLKEVDKQVTAWLAADERNAQEFLAHPIETLTKAGVVLSRSEQKTLARGYAAAKEPRVVGPGVSVKKVSASGFAKGQVGQVKNGVQETKCANEDFGCEPRGKE